VLYAPLYRTGWGACQVHLESFLGRVAVSDRGKKALPIGGDFLGHSRIHIAEGQQLLRPQLLPVILAILNKTTAHAIS
jgi:hypothetical protein